MIPNISTEERVCRRTSCRFLMVVPDVRILPSKLQPHPLYEGCKWELFLNCFAKVIVVGVGVALIKATRNQLHSDLIDERQGLALCLNLNQSFLFENAGDSLYISSQEATMFCEYR
ncbi:hypothetical protein IV203_009830 [Nitzschia inconspicua]|uniref:Uncharacterized protein n=1 Tax=Nitzschia inconspicua TaxID=303405 RepID=A0A9K3PKA5_9STRA|nr:hypothetical protein IV203_009830 [Nitzschia inconspicua]